MYRFIAECNIDRFQAMLRDAVDPAERRLIEGLLAEQQDSLREALATEGSGAFRPPNAPASQLSA